MHIEISYSGTDRSDALDARVRKSVEGELSRFAERLTRVEVHLSDNNAAKSGADDKAVVLEARPRGLDPIVVKDAGNDLYELARGASRKMGRALEREFDRRDPNK
ncbi:MAG: HPF/RaiA family ribosome-associated protein [Phycisphaerales bacterium]|nr:HPF/RaiA family ribosome-associated protein [Phycisphaerales bacterium]